MCRLKYNYIKLWTWVTQISKDDKCQLVSTILEVEEQHKVPRYNRTRFLYKRDTLFLNKKFPCGTFTRPCGLSLKKKTGYIFDIVKHDMHCLKTDGVFIVYEVAATWVRNIMS